MVKSVKILWICAVVVNIASLVFFISLANIYTQGFIIEIINVLVLQVVGIPSVGLIVASLIILIFNRRPLGWLGYTGALIMIAGLLLIAGYFFSFAWYV